MENVWDFIDEENQIGFTKRENTMEFPLLNLPIEIITKIILELDIQSIINLTYTCRILKNIIHNTTGIIYTTDNFNCLYYMNRMWEALKQNLEQPHDPFANSYPWDKIRIEIDIKMEDIFSIEFLSDITLKKVVSITLENKMYKKDLWLLQKLYPKNVKLKMYNDAILLDATQPNEIGTEITIYKDVIGIDDILINLNPKIVSLTFHYVDVNLEKISRFTNLKYLTVTDIGHPKVPDVSILKSLSILTNLEVLDISGNASLDLGYLSHLKRLKKVICISHVSPEPELYNIDKLYNYNGGKILIKYNFFDNMYSRIKGEIEKIAKLRSWINEQLCCESSDGIGEITFLSTSPP